MEYLKKLLNLDCGRFHDDVVVVVVRGTFLKCVGVFMTTWWWFVGPFEMYMRFPDDVVVCATF